MSAPLERDPVALNAPQLGVAAFALLMLATVWLLSLLQLDDSRQQTLERQAAALANLSLIVAENLAQVLDRGRTLQALAPGLQQPDGADADRIAALMLADPVFNRLSLFDQQGQRVFATSPGGLLLLDRAWLVPGGADNGRPVRVLPDQARGPRWSLPLLLPAGPQEACCHLLLELDLGYLLDLYQRLELGGLTSIQIIDQQGRTLVQVEQGGLVPGQGRFDNSLITRSRLLQGRFTAFDQQQEQPFLTLFQRVHELPFLVVVRQSEREILAPYRQQRDEYLLTVLLLTLVVLVGVAWLLWMMHVRETQLRALEHSEQRNQRLLDRLRREHRQSQEAASRDALTGLYNRRLFMELARSHLSGARRQGRFAAVLFIDLDRFKMINDSLGHRIGDQLLQTVAARLQETLRDSDIISRFGGDEFVVMLTGVQQREAIERKVRQLVQALAAPYAPLAGSGLNTSPSIGVALSPQDGADIETLVGHADMAMYAAKKAGRGRHAFFDQLQGSAELDAEALARQLPAALAQQVLVYLQPRLSLPDYRVTGFEALVRWQHPEYGLLLPARWLPQAEALGLMPRLALQVLEQLCAQLQQWHRAGEPVRPIAVNLSRSQWHACELSLQLPGLLHRYGIQPGWLELEIDEQALDAPAPELLARLRQWQQLGISLTVDNFGSHGLEIEQLRRLPFTRLKLDPAYIRAVHNRYDDNLMLSATISVAQRQGLCVVAKGVETPDQLVHLKLAGCNEVQGHLFSRAVPVDEALRYSRQPQQEMSV